MSGKTSQTLYDVRHRD